MGPKGPFKIGLLDRSILGKGPIYSEESDLLHNQTPQEWRNRGCNPHFSDQLTLLQTGVGQIMPTNYEWHPHFFLPSALPTSCMTLICTIPWPQIQFSQIDGLVSKLSVHID